MLDRICISINNRCNLSCTYCHFHEKSDSICNRDMDVYDILNRVMKYIDTYHVEVFKIGFVGNGEPLLDYQSLKGYILHIADYLTDGRIMAYTITNSIPVTREMLLFFHKHNVTLGYSLDGLAKIHNKYRCGTHATVLEKMELYKEIYGQYPSINCTVGNDILTCAEETIRFFEKFGSRITFSRMIGKYGIPLVAYSRFLSEAMSRLNVRIGKYDCTMYGGMCGAGMNNFFFANGYVYLCGNCVDQQPIGVSSMSFEQLETDGAVMDFNRQNCYKESYLCV